MAFDGPRNGHSVSFVTMGCAKNEVDSAHMADRARAGGYLVCDDPEHSDAVVVNTCSFIQAATEESIEAILEVAGFDSVARGDSRLIVAGCMPARYGADLEAELPEVSSFIPCSKEDDIVSVLDGLFGIERIGTGELAIAPPAAGTAPVSAYVKISDGCDRFCSYCSIPYIRGRYHSYTYEQVRSEVSRLVCGGTREIVLIAQDTGRWGRDFAERSSLASLLGRLAEEFRDTWFRVMYIQPEGITDELLDCVAGHDNVCSYFDIPLQHVDAGILAAMNRRGSRESYEQLLERILDHVPDATLRTTLIAGFPGEDDEQFEELCDFVEEAPFDYVGVFAYSREEGTKAFDLSDQVDEDEKRMRAQTLRDLADDVCTARVAARIGREMPVLVCGTEEDGQLFGRAMCQAPDVDGVTYLESGMVGEIVNVRIDDALLYEMEGSPCPSK